MQAYETPEIVDLGDARELTLGRPNLDLRTTPAIAPNRAACDEIAAL